MMAGVKGLKNIEAENGGRVSFDENQKFENCASPESFLVVRRIAKGRWDR
jgi:hypothetical protein